MEDAFNGQVGQESNNVCLEIWLELPSYNEECVDQFLQLRIPGLRIPQDPVDIINWFLDLTDLTPFLY